MGVARRFPPSSRVDHLDCVPALHVVRNDYDNDPRGGHSGDAVANDDAFAVGALESRGSEHIGENFKI